MSPDSSGLIFRLSMLNFKGNLVVSVSYVFFATRTTVDSMCFNTFHVSSQYWKIFLTSQYSVLSEFLAASSFNFFTQHFYTP